MSLYRKLLFDFLEDFEHIFIPSGEVLSGCSTIPIGFTLDRRLLPNDKIENNISLDLYYSSYQLTDSDSLVHVVDHDNLFKEYMTYGIAFVFLNYFAKTILHDPDFLRSNDSIDTEFLFNNLIENSAPADEIVFIDTQNIFNPVLNDVALLILKYKNYKGSGLSNPVLTKDLLDGINHK